jgi:integrase
MLHFSALRQFLRWAGNPIADRRSVWGLPSGEPTRRRWLGREQLRRLYRHSTGAARVLVGLEGLNGLRRVEVLRLRFQDILDDEDCLLVRGKGSHGGKWRKIPMHRLVRRDLARWRLGHQPEEPVLPRSRSGADLLLRRAVASAGFPPELRVSHHDLRRTFGRLAHEAGMDLVQLKNMLGHASMEMSVHYIGLDSDRMREGLERFSNYLR